MKRLSDYKGEEAIELWADLIDFVIPIFDDDLKNIIRSSKSKITIAKTILKSHSKEAEQILLRIDPTPIDGLNIVIRLVEILNEIGSNETLKGFFGFAEQEKTDNESFGSVTENTEGAEK